jgi:uncharacterized membrane protein
LIGNRLNDGFFLPANYGHNMTQAKGTVEYNNPKRKRPHRKPARALEKLKARQCQAYFFFFATFFLAAGFFFATFFTVLVAFLAVFFLAAGFFLATFFLAVFFTTDVAIFFAGLRFAAGFFFVAIVSISLGFGMFP